MTTPPAAGRLNRLLRVDKNTSTTSNQAADGYQAPVWVEQMKMWCNVRPRPGGEMIKDAAEQWQQPVLVTMRYADKLATMLTTPTQWRLRLVEGSVTTYFDIVTVMNVDMRNTYLELTCVIGSMVPA